MTIEEKIAVIQTHNEGKIVEFHVKGKLDPWKEMGMIDEFNFVLYDYRVKPELKVKPYTMVEFINAQSEHGMYLGLKKRRGGYEWVIPNRVYDAGLRFINYNASSMTTISWEQLAENYEWIDGTPCGIEELV